MIDKIINSIKEVCKDENISIDFNKMDSTLKDFKIDSLAAMNLIMKVEEKIGVTLDDEILINIKTLGDLVDAFNKKIN